jgi:hypothetical protein
MIGEKAKKAALFFAAFFQFMKVSAHA